MLRQVSLFGLRQTSQLRAPFSSSAALQLAIDRLDVSPAALEVKEPDLLPVGGLAAAAALAEDAAHAQRGAPRRASAAASAARPAAAARAALAPCLAPLACTPLSTLEVEGDAPWTVIAYLSGMLGPCLGQAERDRAAAVLAKLVAAAPTLNVSGHVLDRRFGLRQQRYSENGI